MTKVTKVERQVLEVLWESNVPLSIRDMISKNAKLNKNTVPVVVRKLIGKKLIEVAYIKKNNKSFAQFFNPTITKEKFVQKDLSPKNLKLIVANFIESSENEKELDLLEELIANKRKKLNEEGK